MKYRALLVDLDGTINLGNDLIPGADRIYRDLSDLGIKWLFLSNSATALAGDLALKISKLGLPVSEDQVISSASALLREVQRNFLGAKIMVVGHERLKRGLVASGAVISGDPSAADIVVVALDTQFTYEKMKLAHRAIQRGALFWATNLDPTYPESDGFSPGAGSVVASIATATGKAPDRIFGKPYPDMAAIALERLGLPKADCLVVGDRMDTDIRFAKNGGIPSALVLTGSTSLEDLPKYPFSPDHVLQSVSDLRTLMCLNDSCGQDCPNSDS
jgi:HAD superfamily hydrolase (TIGR01450 family)